MTDINAVAEMVEALSHFPDRPRDLDDLTIMAHQLVKEGVRVENGVLEWPEVG